MSEAADADPEFLAAVGADPVVGTSRPRLLGILGPGLITSSMRGIDLGELGAKQEYLR